MMFVVAAVVETTRFPPESSVKLMGNGVGVGVVPFFFVMRIKLNEFEESEGGLKEFKWTHIDIANAPFFNCIFSGIVTVVDVVVEWEASMIGTACFCCW
jgi:hypothetical protein